MKTVEICDDMACIIFNETGYDLANYLELESGLIRKEIKGNVFLVEEQMRYFPNKKWWVIEINKTSKIKGCDDF